ncbi:MAG: hypothetical protein AB7S26_34230 [Sandaracinaceae bacterium]
MIVVWGIGEVGGVFAHGFLRAGHAVEPLTRAMDPEERARTLSAPELVVVAVGERDLAPVLDAVPDEWSDRLLLVQNELVPSDWEAYGILEPTVASVWFEKKRDKPLKVLMPTPIGGPRAGLAVRALGAVRIDAVEVPASELAFELVKKNLYILTTNIAGLRVGGTTSQLWREHRQLARDVAQEVLEIQRARVRAPVDGPALFDALVDALLADPDHGCTGRTAPARLARALDVADRAGLRVPTLRAIATAAGITPG